MSGPQLVDTTVVLAAWADAARLWLQAIAAGAMRSLSSLPSGRGVVPLPLAGLAVAGVIVLTHARHAILAGRRTTNVDASAGGASCRMPTRRGSRGPWTCRRAIAFLRPRARAGDGAV